MAGCQTTQKSNNTRPLYEVKVGPGAFTSGEKTLAAWITYGTTKARLKSESFETKSIENEFKIECDARQAMIEFWNDPRPGKSSPPNKYLTEVTEIYNKGYLKQYVYKYMFENTQVTQPEKMNEFEEYMLSNFPEHKLEAHAAIE